MKGTLYWGMLTTGLTNRRWHSRIQQWPVEVSQWNPPICELRGPSFRPSSASQYSPSSSVFLTAHSAKCRYRGAVKRGLTKNHRPQSACTSASPLVRGAFYGSKEGLQKRVFALVIRGFWVHAAVHVKKIFLAPVAPRAYTPHPQKPCKPF